MLDCGSRGCWFKSHPHPTPLRIKASEMEVFQDVAKLVGCWCSGGQAAGAVEVRLLVLWRSICWCCGGQSAGAVEVRLLVRGGQAAGAVEVRLLVLRRSGCWCSGGQAAGAQKVGLLGFRGSAARDLDIMAREDFAHYILRFFSGRLFE